MRTTLFLGVILLSSTVPAWAADLEVGVAAIDITPPHGYRMAGYFHERVNTGTRDPLFAKAIVFRQGDRQAALVCCDLVAITEGVSHLARAKAAQTTGIPATNIAIAATHSHTGPLYFGVLRNRFHKQAVARNGRDPHEEVDYSAQLTERIANAIAQAQANAAPARLAAGSARETTLSFNRRFHMKDGTVRFNPGAFNPDIVRVAGPIDPEVGLLLVRTARDNRPLAALTVFALHLDTVGAAEYSADYPAYLEAGLKEAFGPGFVSLFGAGTCGDINHINVKTREQAKTAAIGARLTQTVKQGLATLPAVAEPSLDVAAATVNVAVQRPTPAEIADAESKMGQIGSSSLSFLEQVKAVTVVDLAENYREPTTALEVQVFRLSRDVGIVTLPGEVFVELGLAIKKASPFRTTIVIELTNSIPAYVPTKKAFAEGSYEVVNSRVQAGGGERLVETAIELLTKLHAGGR
jgi:hypothetical protein